MVVRGSLQTNVAIVTQLVTQRVFAWTAGVLAGVGLRPERQD
jgi:hypothetical protein